MKTSEFIEGIADQCLNELKTVDINDPEGDAQRIIEKYMLRLVVDID